MGEEEEVVIIVAMVVVVVVVMVMVVVVANRSEFINFINQGSSWRKYPLIF